jgi:hypothetical protein
VETIGIGLAKELMLQKQKKIKPALADSGLIFLVKQRV